MNNPSKPTQALPSSPGRHTRRTFLQGLGAAGMACFSNPGWGAILSDAVRQAAEQAGKKINLLNDEGFEGSAWGWQFTANAAIEKTQGKTGSRSLGIHTTSGDYARYLVLEPEVGKTYTLTGWVKTREIVEEEDSAGAYFSASQFEFQGRPSEYTVAGKQYREERYGNFTGTSEWRRFSKSFVCLPSTTWFEVVLGIYRASGSAWFSDLTFVEGDQPAESKDVIDYWQAAQLAHASELRLQKRTRPAAAILRDNLPIHGVASDPEEIARDLRETYTVDFLTARQLADPTHLSRARYDLLVLPSGESFPLPAKPALERFLADGGDLFTTGGYAFQSPLVPIGDGWELYSEKVRKENGPNLLPGEISKDAGWKPSDAAYASVGAVQPPPPGGSPSAACVRIPRDARDQSAEWTFDMPADGDRKQFLFQAWIRTDGIVPSPDGYAYVGVEQLDNSGQPAYAAEITFERLQISTKWHKVEHLFYLIPTCVTLRVRIGLLKATGTIWGAGFRLEHRSPQVRINTALGFPRDELGVTPWQIGIFDASFPLERVSAIHAAPGQSLIAASEALDGAFTGYAATAVIGANHARWVPLLRAVDKAGRNRGAAGAIVYNSRGVYARSAWAFFGVENQDLFRRGSAFGSRVLKAVARQLTTKCFLHACETQFASYKDGESVKLRVLVSNYGRQPVSLELHWTVEPADHSAAAFQTSRAVHLDPGQTEAVEANWRPESFSADFYRAAAVLSLNGTEIDQIETGFNVWKSETLAQGLKFQFKDNYFQVEDRSVFLQGTDDYLHTFLDESENPWTWHDDIQGCHDACINVYENLMGLRGPQQRPTKTWWRWIDAMLLNTQRSGDVFFPGMLIFSNTSVSNKDLDDQKAYVRAFAARYKEAAGIMYYLNGDLELHDPNLPDLQAIYHRFLRDKYGSDQALREAWKISPPEVPINQLSIRKGTDDWADVRTADDFSFKTTLVVRWLNTLYDEIRKVDQDHPITAEIYPIPTDGIDLATALGKLDLANFGYFDSIDEDFYGFPQTCRFLDQSLRGRGINVGEFGVKTHPAWKATRGYIKARTEPYEHSLFLGIAHYSFALGASKIQNWCWKYPSDLPFEWGMNFPNELVPRDVLAFYRNTGLLFRQLRPRYEPSSTLVLLATENRIGGQGNRVFRGELNGIRLLLDQQLRFGAVSDRYMEAIPEGVTTIFYPLPYCPDDAIVEKLSGFVDKGGQLYISGDISYDSLRQRTRTRRLKDLCGLEFVSERYPNVAYGHGAIETAPNSSGWPAYAAAPGIVTRPAGAKVLLAGKDGTPIVTEFAKGRGRVIFSSDPIELHGDARYHGYAHAFYRELMAVLNLKGEGVGAPNAPLHCFRVPSQDSRQIVVLVNYGAKNAIRNIEVSIAGRTANLTLDPKMSGILVGDSGTGLQAAESSADVREDGELVIGSNLHCITASLDREALRRARSVLLLPMGQGLVRLPEARRWRRPVVLVGQGSGSAWKQEEQFTPTQTDGALKIPVTADRALSMMIVCESGKEPESIRRMEQWLNAPWKAG